MNTAAITDALRALGCSVKEKEPMCHHTSFKIGGAAQWFVSVKDKRAAASVLRFCSEQHLPLIVVGNGSNLLVSDTGIDGVVLHIETGDTPFTAKGCCVTAVAGASLTRLCLWACERGLSGLEFAYGIPGTVGGGVYMNAGAYGGQLSDAVQRVTAISAQGECVELSAETLKFGYRHSVLMEQPLTAWSVTLALQNGDPAAIRAKMEQHMAARKAKQPLEYPSAGSFFKRPEGHFAGALIEQCGLKGYTVGGAQISEKHAGFVINRGGATCADVIQLCRNVQQKVKDTFGVSLEREVQLVGKG